MRRTPLEGRRRVGGRERIQLTRRAPLSPRDRLAIDTPLYPCAHPRVVVFLYPEVGKGPTSCVYSPRCYHLIVVVRRRDRFLDTYFIDLHSSYLAHLLPTSPVHISRDTSPALGTLLVFMYIQLHCDVILLVFHHF